MIVQGKQSDEKTEEAVQQIQEHPPPPHCEDSNHSSDCISDVEVE